MERDIKFDNRGSFKLKNINEVNTDNFSINTLGSSAFWSGPNQIGKEISLILGDSFTLDKSDKLNTQSLIFQHGQMMLNKKNNLKMSFQSGPGDLAKWENSTGQNNRILPEKEYPNFDEFVLKNLDKSRSTTCNLILEEDDDDERELDNFLRQKEGFKKHCEDEMEDELRDPNFLSNEEINSIIKEKMRILDIYNVVVLKQGKDDINFR